MEPNHCPECGRSNDHIEPTIVDEATLQQCASVDTAYEVDQFCTWSTIKPADQRLTDHQNLRLGQAGFEVALLHYRNLASFLRGGRPTQKHRRSDVVADHYFDEGWQRTTSLRLYNRQSSKQDSRARRMIDTHLAHITTTRHHERGAGQSFSWAELEPVLLIDAFLGFTADLRRTHSDRAAWFEPSEHRLTEARSMYAQPIPPIVTSTN